MVTYTTESKANQEQIIERKVTKAVVSLYGTRDKVKEVVYLVRATCNDIYPEPGRLLQFGIYMYKVHSIYSAVDREYINESGVSLT